MSNDYKELSITEITSLYILLGSQEFPSAMAGTCHVTSGVPVYVSGNLWGRDRWLSLVARVSERMIGPRVVRWSVWVRAGS